MTMSFVVGNPSQLSCMKFVALVSGGKDSCFNVLHCLKQGHELVATANLYPKDESLQELDSYMFQTVGHDVVSYYGECTGLPLFRRPILLGGSKNLDMNYTRTADDEIEDLYSLLLEVKNEIPDLEAVSVGAILSSYQRTRVEDVCRRLNLTVLSYLWQRDQLELMTEMCFMSNDHSDAQECPGRLDARIIKVAAIGLDQTHLNKSLPEIFPVMRKLNRIYDVHICGEGGEFETMVLDAPFFSKKRLRIASEEIDTSDRSNGVYSVRLGVSLEERNAEVDIKSQLDKLPVPGLLNEKWSALLDSLKSLDSSWTQPEPSPKFLPVDGFKPQTSVSHAGSLVFISNIRPTDTGTSLRSQALEVFQKLDKFLQEQRLSPSQAINCNLLLSSMSDFALVNEVYNEYFDISKYGPLPPSRACVETNLLGEGYLLQLSIVFDMASQVHRSSTQSLLYPNKNGLHVQGRSYWAPCNIGPYSQATWLKEDVNQVTYISGQIALNPGSMDMVERDRKLQSVLSLRHFDTLKSATGAVRQLFMTCFVSDVSMVPVSARTWSLYCNEMQYESDLWMSKDEDPLESLVIVKVTQLPRKALCEWGGGSCQQIEFEESSEDEEGVNVPPEVRTVPGILSNIKVSGGRMERHFMTGFSNSVHELMTTMQSIDDHFKMTLYYNPANAGNIISCLGKLENIEFVPVTQVFDYSGNSHSFGYHIIVV